MQSCRTDTDPIYSLVSDPLPKCFIAFLGTDLDQISTSSDSKGTICIGKVALFRGIHPTFTICSLEWGEEKGGRWGEVGGGGAFLYCKTQKVELSSGMEATERWILGTAQG